MPLAHSTLPMSKPGEEFFHLQCRLCFHTMPMGNRLPLQVSEGMSVSGEAAAAPLASKSGNTDTQQGMPLPAVPKTPEDAKRDVFVDAHSIKGMPMDKVIEEIANAAPKSMPPEELMLRRQIATTLLITMGRKVAHFEGEIDSETGTIDVDFKFSRIISEDQHLQKTLGKFDPEDPEMKIKDCAVMRLYTHSIDAASDDRSAFHVFLSNHL